MEKLLAEAARIRAYKVSPLGCPPHQDLEQNADTPVHQSRLGAPGPEEPGGATRGGDFDGLSGGLWGEEGSGKCYSEISWVDAPALVCVRERGDAGQETEQIMMTTHVQLPRHGRLFRG